MDFEDADFSFGAEPTRFVGVLPPSGYGISPTDNYYAQLDFLYKRFQNAPAGEQRAADEEAYKNVLDAALTERERKEEKAQPTMDENVRSLQATESGGTAEKAASGAAAGAAFGSVIPGIGNAVGAALGALGSLFCGGKSKSKSTTAKQAGAIAKSIGPDKVAKYFHCSRRTAQVDLNPQSPTYGFCVGVDDAGNRVVEPPVIDAQKMLDELGASLSPETRASLEQIASEERDDQKRMIMYGAAILGVAGFGVYKFAQRKKK